MQTLLNKPLIVIAVDPGLSGAVARIGCGEIMVRRDFKRLEEVQDAIHRFALPARPCAFIIEQVGARPGQGVCSMFSFGKATGVAFGALFAEQTSCGIFLIDEVHPLRWQNWVRKELKMEKKAPFDSRQICLDQFPCYAQLFSRKKDHNTADAVLMGLYRLGQFGAN